MLCAVLDVAALGPDPHSFARALFESGVDWIQLRDRSIESDALHAVARMLVAAARQATLHASAGTHDAVAAIAGRAPRVLINRRIDVALATRADGVHLGFDAIDPLAARRLLGDSAVVGVALHSPAEAKRLQHEQKQRQQQQQQQQSPRVPGNARNEGSRDPSYPISYAHLAPIWDPVSKPATRPPLGEGALREAARAGIPLLAQGGINGPRAQLAIESGASGVAVTGLLSRATEPTRAASELRRFLDLAVAPKGTFSRNQRSSGGDLGSMP